LIDVIFLVSAREHRTSVPLHLTRLKIISI